MSMRRTRLAASLSLLAGLAACGGSAFTDGAGGAPSTTHAASTSTTNAATTTGVGGAMSSSTDTGDVGTSVGAGGASTTSSTTGSSATSGAGGASSTSASTGGGCGVCALGLTCCGDVCRNLLNDPTNCGGCDNHCGGDISFCQDGQCVPPPCNQGTVCANSAACCGSACCADGTICCLVSGPVDQLGCVAPVDGTCPVGCPKCQ